MEWGGRIQATVDGASTPTGSTIRVARSDERRAKGKGSGSDEVRQVGALPGLFTRAPLHPYRGRLLWADVASMVCIECRAPATAYETKV